MTTNINKIFILWLDGYEDEYECEDYDTSNTFLSLKISETESIEIPLISIRSFTIS